MTLIDSYVAAASPSFLGFFARLPSRPRRPAPPQAQRPKPRLRNALHSSDIAIRLHNVANGARLR